MLTAIFDGYDELQQPAAEATAALTPDERRCFFAIVDRRSHDLLAHENAGIRTAGRAAGAAGARLGVWQLLVVEGRMPFVSSRRNSRVPKMLPHRLFPAARRAPRGSARTLRPK